MCDFGKMSANDKITRINACFVEISKWNVQ